MRTEQEMMDLILGVANIIICKGKSRTIVEYALKTADIKKSLTQCNRAS